MHVDAVVQRATGQSRHALDDARRRVGTGMDITASYPDGPSENFGRAGAELSFG